MVDCPSYNSVESFNTDYTDVREIVINPTDFADNAETCTVTVLGSAITDADSNLLDGDGDGLLGGDYTFSFTVSRAEDVDKDGIVTPVDAIYVINRLGQTLDETNQVADVNGDSVINADDVLMVQEMLGTSQ